MTPQQIENHLANNHKTETKLLEAEKQKLLLRLSEIDTKIESHKLKEEKKFAFILSNGRFVKIEIKVEERIEGLFIMTKIGHHSDIIHTSAIDNYYVTDE